MKSDNNNIKITFKNNFFLKCLQSKKERHKLSQLLFNNTINSTFNEKGIKSSSNSNINKNEFKFNIYKLSSKDKLIKRENIENKFESIGLTEKSEKNNYDWNILLNTPELDDIDIKNKVKLTDLNENKFNKNKSNPKRDITNINNNIKMINQQNINNINKNNLNKIPEKVSILKAKIMTSTKKLRNEIIKQRIQTSKEEKKLYEILNKDNLILNKQDLIIAGERKNAEPLLKNILYQQNPRMNLKTAKKSSKLYYKTMKPFGNNYGNIDYTKNDRWKSSAEIKNLREKEHKQYSNVGTSMDDNILINSNHNDNNNNIKLVLSYYDTNDPDIKYFNCLLNKYNKRVISFQNGKNIENFNSFNSFNNDDKAKEKIYLSSTQSSKRVSSIKNKMKNKEISKFPFIVEHFKKNPKSTERKNKLYNDRKYFATESNRIFI